MIWKALLLLANIAVENRRLILSIRLRIDGKKIAYFIIIYGIRWQYVNKVA
ncbi:MAG: hypothetical protein AB8W37_08230 [Arsenophonus endosymbiont of Dermacentor nuttalli]